MSFTTSWLQTGAAAQWNMLSWRPICEVIQMKVTILHDEHGRIISVSKIGDLKKAGSKFVKVGMLPGPGQWVLEIDLSGDLERKPLLELHNEYHVDPVALKLMKKH
jgi:hypothetical protein